ncbi:serine/threonine-protein kinase [Salinarimonas sp.]|uniref:serine/threonine-protein kinase n=1 Tax=Salinarimonas sp. TaxID=2766526 RepID=UPI0032D911E9
MSEVHECLDRHLDRYVMLKRVKRVGDFRRLLDEQKALLAVRSPHVVQLLDIVSYEYQGEDENGLILEKIEGVDLEGLVLKSEAEQLHAAWQIACGLTHIHSANVVHRDIKPQNIRVSSEGTVKILDFGLSRSVGVDSKTRSVIGTSEFMAPELFGEQTISFSSSVDIYAFGVTLLKIFNIAIPPVKRGSTPEEILRAISDNSSAFQHDLALLISKCLAPVPNRRPSSEEVQLFFEQKLLHNRHRGRILLGGKVHEINKDKRALTLSTKECKLSIEYDGKEFTVKSVMGRVMLNNRPAVPGSRMIPACVISFEGSNSPRTFTTFETNSPQVQI